MKVYFVAVLNIFFQLIYCFNTYPPEIYNALRVIAQQKSLDKNYFENCVFIGSSLGSDLSNYNTSVIKADDTLVVIASRLNENLLTIKHLNKLNSGEKILLRTFNNMITRFLQLVVTPETSFQNSMRVTCSRNSNEIHSVIQKFDITLDMIGRSYFNRHNFSDSSFQAFDEFSRSIARQVAATYPICETFLASKTESTVSNLESMIEMLNEKLYRFNEDRRKQFWSFDFVDYIVKKKIETSTNDQDLADKIQNYFESEYRYTDFVFSVFVFNNNTHPYLANDNAFIFDYDGNKTIIITRTNERRHCPSYDTIEANIKNACVNGGGTKVEKIRNYLTAKCPNSTVLVMDDSIQNYVFATNKEKPSVKYSNMSYYYDLDLFNFFEQCLKRVLIAIINN